MRGSVELDVTTGGIKVVANNRKSQVQVHGIVMIVVWGLVAPFAILMKRFGGRWDMGKIGKYPVPFVVHVGFLVGVVVLTVVVTALALKQFQSGTIKGHKPIAITLLAVCGVQILMNICRPAPDAPSRVYFNIPHRTLGVGIYILATVQLFVGIRNYEVLYNDSHYANVLRVIASVFISFAFVLAIVLHIFTKVRKDEVNAPDNESPYPDSGPRK
eukprot:TRINITY_DN5757_c0_g5_i1.p1 TRINITY_DN5757_c0_g5~~TRINITY_DN5757_c0_g5_i1.p1  ORF type:complete len:242 (+),score=51.33 TRINITY_DN5757_c0_g5_i1:84-728(+)